MNSKQDIQTAIVRIHDWKSLLTLFEEGDTTRPETLTPEMLAEDFGLEISERESNEKGAFSSRKTLPF